MADDLALKPFYNEASVPVDDQTLRLVIDFRAIDVIEGLIGENMDAILPRLLVQNPPHALMGKFLWAMTRQHHPSLTLDQVAGLLYRTDGTSDRIGLAGGDLIRRAFNIGDADDAGGKERQNPTDGAPDGASKTF